QGHLDFMTNHRDTHVLRGRLCIPAVDNPEAGIRIREELLPDDDTRLHRELSHAPDPEHDEHKPEEHIERRIGADLDPQTLAVAFDDVDLHRHASIVTATASSAARQCRTPPD